MENGTNKRRLPLFVLLLTFAIIGGLTGYGLAALLWQKDTEIPRSDWR